MGRIVPLLACFSLVTYGRRVQWPAEEMQTLGPLSLAEVSSEDGPQRVASEPPVPLDLRLGLTTPVSGREVRWCFIGTGRVAHDFAQALKSVDGAVLSVVAARNEARLSRTKEFAALHGFQYVAPSYADALARSDVDIVYLNTLHQYRVQHVETILKAGKPVLVEKPFALNAADARRLVELARKKDLFIMEGMWTRFFPAVEQARALIDSGTLGGVVKVLSDFSFNAGDGGNYPVKPYPEITPNDGDPIFHLESGGGSLLYAGPYPLAAGVLPFTNLKPKRVVAAGVVDPYTQIDLSFSLSLSFEKAGGPADAESNAPQGSCPPRGASVSIAAGVDGESTEFTSYVGTRGRITILPPAHCPTSFKLEVKGEGRGNVSEIIHEYPLPSLPSSVLAAPTNPGSTEYFYYPNSNGFQYEAEAVQRCLLAGLKECPQYPNDEMLKVMDLMDQVRTQIHL